MMIDDLELHERCINCIRGVLGRGIAALTESSKSKVRGAYKHGHR